MNGRLLGIDHGIKRIGLALSDATGLIARELFVLERKSKREDFAKINQIAEGEAVIGFVVGIPYSDAPQGVHTQADTVRLWIERFQQTTDLPIMQWDEQLTSDEAQDLARQLKRPFNEPIDDLAARLILQGYLDAVRDGLATFSQRSNE